MSIDFSIIVEAYKHNTNDKMKTFEYMCEYFDVDFTGEEQEDVSNIINAVEQQSYKQTRCLFWLPRPGINGVFETVIMHDKLGCLKHIKKELICQNMNGIPISSDIDEVQLKEFYEELFNQSLSDNFNEELSELYAQHIGFNTGKTIKQAVYVLAERIFYNQPLDIPRGDINYYIMWLMRNYLNYLNYFQSQGQDPLYKRSFLSFLNTYEARFMQGIDWDEEMEVITNSDIEFVNMQRNQLKQFVANKYDKKSNQVGRPPEN